jgi:nucleoside-diphosphate-sugar epimerase
MPKKADLTVAVTGPTGTFGFGLMPLLQEDPRITKIVGIARRPFDPAEHGWDKMEYRQGDVREPEALEEAFADADVVVHLAFMITGNAPRETIRAINVDGTLNVFRAAVAAENAQRFVYASSVAAYGWFPDNPVGMDEEWPTRRASRLFYGQEKAELEELLNEEAEKNPEIELFLLRPPIVLGPNAVGGKDILPGPLGTLTGRVLALMRDGRLPIPTLAPKLPVQFIHEADVGQAFIQCITREGPPGAYNITGDGVMTGDEIARELGLTPIPLPAKPAHLAARALAKVPMPGFVPPATEWVEPLSHPSIMDASKAKEELGWEPKYTSVEALRDTLAAL